MATRRRAAPKSAFERRMEERTAAQSKAALAGIGSWLTFTLATDTSPRAFGKVPHALLNWVVIAAVAAAAWKLPAGTPRLVVAGVAVVAVVYSIGRAARHLKGRRKAVEAVFAVTGASCKHPRSTVTRPVDPAQFVRVRRWLTPAVPQTGVVVVNSGAPAEAPTGRWAAESDIEKVADGRPVVFDWSTPGQVGFTVTTPDDPRVAQRMLQRSITAAATALFPRPGSDFDVEVDWAGDDSAQPVKVTVTYGHTIYPDRALRSAVERGFDDRVKIGCEWVYDWSAPGMLAIDAADPQSPEALRKRAARKVVDGATAILTRIGGRGAAGQVDAQVTDWYPDGTPRANTPERIVVYFGTTDFSDVSRRHSAVDALDQMLEAEWKDRTWIPEWQFGHAGQVTLDAVEPSSAASLRKVATARVRQVVTAGFPRTAGLDVEVTDWAVGDAGEQMVAQMEVHYGTGNMTERLKQVAFETHLDAQTRANDWRYEWDAAPGLLKITAVTPLPAADLFPAEGTPEHNEWHQRFRSGVVWFGHARGGYEATVKFNTTPHTLVGGATGAGKSQWLGLVLYGALMNPDVCELIVIDPKVTDFTWTGGYPNVIAYAPTDARKAAEQIMEAVKIAYNSMLERQMLLQRYGVRNLGYLRDAIRDGRITDMDLSEVPRRLIVFFDEGGAAFTPSKDPDVAALQNQARAWMEQIAMLGRAMEVNIVMAAQKPSAENIGTAMREQCGNRIGIGHLDQFTSQQVMGSNICDTRLPAGAPKGRGWFVNDEGKELLFQCPYLPNDDETCPWDLTVQLRGIKEQVADMLTSTGWQEKVVDKEVTRPKDPTAIDNGETVSYTIRQSLWVRADRIDTGD